MSATEEVTDISKRKKMQLKIEKVGGRLERVILLVKRRLQLIRK